MKKLIMTLAIVSSIMTYGKTTVTVKTNEVDAVQTIEKKINAYKTSGKWCVNVILGDWTGVDSEIKQKCDDMVVNANIMVSPTFPNTAEYFPKSWNKSIEFYDTVIPGLKEIFIKVNNGEKLNIEENTKQTVFLMYATLKDDHYLTMLTHNKAFINIASKNAKIAIRKQGKSFIGEDGQVLLQKLVNDIQNAASSYRLSGLNEALKAIEMDFGLDFTSVLVPENDINKLKGDILIDKRPFDKTNQQILRTHLGLEKYNEFVKTYNEGTK